MSSNVNIDQALGHLQIDSTTVDRQGPVPFEKFLEIMVSRPSAVLRNVFQFFHDMIMAYVGPGVDEYSDDPESINYVDYDFTRLFVEGADHPFFADRLFANRLMKQVDSLRQGAQQNKIYIFDGPHGGGKSTFLNNLLTKFEEYANTQAGCRFETIWRINLGELGAPAATDETISILEKLLKLQQESQQEQYDRIKARVLQPGQDQYLEVPCPSHDNPLLMIPKQQRRDPFLTNCSPTTPLNMRCLRTRSMTGCSGISPVPSAVPCMKPCCSVCTIR